MNLVNNFIILTFILSTQNLFASSKYTVKDLEILSLNSSFYEFFNHYKDPRPTNRNQYWLKLVKETSQSFFKFVEASEASHKKDLRIIIEMSQNSQLTNDEFYRNSLDSALIKYFNKCAKTDQVDWCYLRSSEIYKSYKGNSLLGVELAKIFYNTSDKANPFQLLDLIKPLLNDPISEFYCDKAPTRDILFNLIEKGMKADSLKMDKDCLKVITPLIETRITTASKPQLRLRYFKFLMNNNKSSSIENFVAVSSLLDNNIKEKKTKLYHFKILERLSSNSNVREKILIQLKQLTIFPDELFKDSSKNASAIVIEFNKSFPELIDYYSTGCLEYLEGKSPDNKLKSCHQFYKKTAHLGLLSDYKINRYNKILKRWKK